MPWLQISSIKLWYTKMLRSFLVLLYNIAKSKKANLQGMAAYLADFHTFIFIHARARQPRYMERFEVERGYSCCKSQYKTDRA